ncbi:hypothetical protein GH714_032226 [Hevea brasiliensis]|uniref:Uncharacterized protein n=1 Tax=Hevea brasiliensis TaxID=3981 RepID=A0A6A6L1K7_HEVBR|nr:hypothetical protein GH714_032226 [Hevea brasiliensis]
MSPFTPGMWFIIVAMGLFTGTVVWLIEHQNHSSESRGSSAKQFGAIISFLSAALHSGQRFKPNNIRNIATIHDTAEALSSGKFKAAFFLKPYAKAFLARYFADFPIVEPTYELGGFGFEFQKGSDLASDMSQAILKLKESGELQLIEEKMLSSFDCSASGSDANQSQSLGPEPFIDEDEELAVLKHVN